MILTIEKIEQEVQKISKDYPLKKVTLFGSYADGSFDENSDVDLIHAPISNDAILEIGEEISLYES